VLAPHQFFTGVSVFQYYLLGFLEMKGQGLDFHLLLDTKVRKDLEGQTFPNLASDIHLRICDKWWTRLSCVPPCNGNTRDTKTASRAGNG
jgi:hypothetical protein